jgi:hypothetical protein
MICFAATLFLKGIGYIMDLSNFNKDKLHAVLCIVASAAISVTLIVKIVNWLF